MADLLTGVELLPTGQVDTPLERVAVLAERYRELANPKQHPYKGDFLNFLSDCVWTIDEACGGRVAKFPLYPFIEDLSDALHLCPRLFIDKSRRVLASWTVCAWDIWLAAGGQDPRWPALMSGDGYRQIYVVSRKYEDSCRFLHRRIRIIIDEFEARGGREFWPEFPRFTWKENEGKADNGSLITAVAQGADQLRGPGATHVHCEEFSTWELAQMTLNGLIPTTKGGGHVTLITTPLANSYARLIRNGAIRGGWRAVTDERQVG
jgi:hypothetical protein